MDRNCCASTLNYLSIFLCFFDWFCADVAIIILKLSVYLRKKGINFGWQVCLDGLIFLLFFFFLLTRLKFACSYCNNFSVALLCIFNI